MKILWNKNGMKFDSLSDPRTSVREEIITDGLLSTIIIKKTDMGDSGLFTCIATNAFGRNNTSINLVVLEAPEAPFELKEEVKNGRNIAISWKAPYNLNVSRFVIEFKPKKGTWKNDIQRVLVSGEDLGFGEEIVAGIFDLRPATSYQFRIVAENANGSNATSDTITVKTSEEAPSGPPLDLKVSVIDQHTLKAQWKAPLREHWNGDILGYNVRYYKIDSNKFKNFNFKTVEIIKEQGQLHELTISNLESRTEYGIMVEAFNKIGPGTINEVRALTPSL